MNTQINLNFFNVTDLSGNMCQFAISPYSKDSIIKISSMDPSKGAKENFIGTRIGLESWCLENGFELVLISMTIDIYDNSLKDISKKTIVNLRKNKIKKIFHVFKTSSEDDKENLVVSFSTLEAASNYIKNTSTVHPKGTTFRISEVYVVV